MIRHYAVWSILALAGALPAAAVTINVNSTADVIADDGVCTLREAIISANNDAASGGMAGECPAGSGNDTVDLGEGTFSLAIPGIDEDEAATGDLDVVDNLTVQGAGPSMTVIDGTGIDRVFDIYPYWWDPISVSITGVTIKGGTTSYDGGGIMEWGETQLILTDCVVRENSAYSGGGIFSYGELSIVDSTVQANTAIGSGGGINQYSGTLTLFQSTVAGNVSSDHGGGIAGRDMIVEASTIESNTAGGYGGGLDVWSSLALFQSTVAGNSSSYGGGGISGNEMIIEASTIHSNIASGDGGGLDVWDSLQLLNSTVSGNVVPGYGGGIYNYGAVTLRNSTIFGNTAGEEGAALANDGTITLLNTIIGGDCSGWYSPVSGGGNLESPGNTCNLILPSDQKNVSSSALNLGPLQNNGGPTLTHRPILPSAAIDRGFNTTCLDEDQRGISRPQDGDSDGEAICDVGSVEVVGCQGDLVVTVQDQTINTTMTIEACREIRLGPNLWVDSPANLTLRAGRKVIFRDGVSIGEGTICRVIIDPLVGTD